MRTAIRRGIRKVFNKFNIDIHTYNPSVMNYDWIYNHNYKTIIDIGAHIGKFSMPLRKIHPDAQIIAFEPLTDAFQILTKNFEKDNNFKAFNVALGNDNKEVEFHRSSHITSSSVLPMAHLHKNSFPNSAGEQIEKALLRKLDDLILDENISLEKEVFTKIDVQGFEYEVISGGLETIAKSKIIICEVSFGELYENQKMFSDVSDLLLSLKFQFNGMLSQIHHPLTGEILQANAIFVKK